MPHRLASFARRPAGLDGAGVPMILVYHSVSPRGPRHPGSLSLFRFEEQMRWLCRHGLRGVSIAELLAARRQGRGAGLVGLTFDHGYADFTEHALPVLAGHGFTATVFALAGRLGGVITGRTGRPPRALMTAEQLRQAADAGMEIGSHGLRQVPLASAEGAALLAETENSRIVLQAASGQPVAGFCYPFGNADGRVIAAVRAAGYSYACGTWRSDYAGPYWLPRLRVGNVGLGWRLAGRELTRWLSGRPQAPGPQRLAVAGRWTS